MNELERTSKRHTCRAFRLRRTLASATLTSLVAILGAGLVGVAPASAWSSRSAERVLRTCVNHERAIHGLPKLRFSKALRSAARSHARSMARGGYFSHTDRSGGSAYQRVARRTDRYRRGVGENIAAGRWTMKRTCREWMRSPGHRAIILDPSFEYSGAGVIRGGRYGRYMVLNVGDSR